MYVCMYVRNGFTIEISLYGFMHLLARATQDAIARWRGVEIEVEDSEDIRRCQNESRCMEDG